MFFFTYDDDFKPILDEEGAFNLWLKENLDLDASIKERYSEQIKQEKNITEDAIPEDEIEQYLEVMGQDYEKYNEYLMTKESKLSNLPANIRAEYRAKWNNLSKEEGKYTKDYLNNLVLKAEIDIFKDTHNYYQMMMPITDDFIKKDLKPRMEEKVRKWMEDPDYAAHVSYISAPKFNHYSLALLPRTNISKSQLYLGGKGGVAIIAVQGVMHSISGQVLQEIKPEMVQQKVLVMEQAVDKKTGNEYWKAKSTADVLVSTRMPFQEGSYNNHLSAIMSKDGQLITEMFSQIMNSQVDIGKDPYAALMGLTLENLVLVSYAIRRGLPLYSILQILQHPIVKVFLQYRTSKESLYSKANYQDKGRNQIVADFISLLDTKYASMKVDTSLLRTSINDIGITYSAINDKNDYKINFTSDGEIIDKGANESETRIIRANILGGFLQILDQSVGYGNVVNGLKPDTKTLKDAEEVQKFKEAIAKATHYGILKNEVMNALLGSPKFLLNPFQIMKEHYDFLFSKLYFNNKAGDVFGRIQSDIQTRNVESKDELKKRVKSDFITYLVQNKIPELVMTMPELAPIKNLDFKDAKKLVNSMVSDIYNYFKANPSYFSTNMNIQFNYNEGVNAMFTSDRMRNTEAINDMLLVLEQIKENNPEIYLKICILPFYSSGLAVRRFNYQDILDNSVRYKIIQATLENKNIDQAVINDFKSRFLEKLSKTKLLVTKGTSPIPNTVHLFRVTESELVMEQENRNFRKTDIFLNKNMGTNPINVKDIESESRVLIDYVSEVLADFGLPQTVEALPNVGSTIKGSYQGTKSGFDNQGKGTPQGDGKDKAMREISSGVIVEVVKENSSSLTSATIITNKDVNMISSKKVTWLSKELLESSKNRNGSLSIILNSNQTVMLARNSEFKGKPLNTNTKADINIAHSKGNSFVVGDMPNVDSQFIEYLLDIGAKFTIYTTDLNEGGRITTQMPELWKRIVGQKTEESPKTVKVKDFKVMSDMKVTNDSEVNTLRQYNTDSHYGNPFTGTGRGTDTIHMSSIPEAVMAYRDWITGYKTEFKDKYGKLHNNIKSKQLEFIRKQIQSGALDNKTLLYYKPYDYYSHADMLRELILRRDSTTYSNTNSKEISSSSKGLLAALTNPTELAKSKGNLEQSYPMSFRGIAGYVDAEAVYWKLKDKSEATTKPPREKSNNYKLMVDILKAKLEQYPRLFTKIQTNGGVEWLKTLTHQPTKQNTVWETGGQDWFMTALKEAYNTLLVKQSEPEFTEYEEVKDTPVVNIRTDNGTNLWKDLESVMKEYPSLGNIYERKTMSNYAYLFKGKEIVLTFMSLDRVKFELTTKPEKVSQVVAEITKNICG